jgi:hypothetical protein
MNRSQSAAAVHVIPPAMITHTVASIRGTQHGDIAVYHARTCDVRIAITWGGVLMTLYSCHAAQGLLEAFAAARTKMVQVPREIPPPPGELDDTFARPTLAIEWTRRPAYAATAQSAVSKWGGKSVHWVDLHTGPITWQIRDRIGLRSTLELLTRAHKTAAAVCLDGEQYSADPTVGEHQIT